jgi:hypothetical protein
MSVIRNFSKKRKSLKKAISLMAILIIFLSGSALALERNLPEPSTGDCVFYEHAKRPLGREWRVTAPSVVPVVDQVRPGWNDILSAVWVRNGYYVEIFRHVYFKQHLILRKQYATPNGWWYDLNPSRDNDQMSSFKCFKGNKPTTKIRRITLMVEAPGTHCPLFDSVDNLPKLNGHLLAIHNKTPYILSISRKLNFKPFIQYGLQWIKPNEERQLNENIRKQIFINILNGWTAGIENIPQVPVITRPLYIDIYYTQ